MTVWPSVGSLSLGQALGRLYRIKSGYGPMSIGRIASCSDHAAGIGVVPLDAVAVGVPMVSADESSCGD
jgi:hypothetical protein